MILFVSAITLAVFGVNIFTLVQLMQGIPEQTAGVYTGFTILILVYIALVTFFAVGPNRWPRIVRKWRSTAHTLLVWIRTNRRWADIESMLEVHF